MPACPTRRGLLPLAALIAAAAARAEARPVIVASFSILGDLVGLLVGDRASVHVIAGPDTDAHAFQPRPSDAEAIRGAALVVRNGLGFEPWLDRMLRAAGYAGPVVTATDGITPRSQGATG